MITQNEDAFEAYPPEHPGWMRLSAMVCPSDPEVVEHVRQRPRRRKSGRISEPSPGYMEFMQNRVDFGPDFDSAA